LEVSYNNIADKTDVIGVAPGVWDGVDFIFDPQNSDSGPDPNVGNTDDGGETPTSRLDTTLEVWDNPFNDVTDTDWFYDAVRALTEKGLMEGTSPGRLNPNITLTRGMIVTMLYRLEEKPEVEGDNPFPDVADGLWYSDAILWASENEIVFGYNNGTFGPDDPVTREQAVTILHRYAEAKELDVTEKDDLSKFVDKDEVSDWALEAMQWAVAVGIIQGRPGNKIAPQGTATRAEIAAIFTRYLENFPE